MHFIVFLTAIFCCEGIARIQEIDDSTFTTKKWPQPFFVAASIWGSVFVLLFGPITFGYCATSVFSHISSFAQKMVRFCCLKEGRSRFLNRDFLDFRSFRVASICRAFSTFQLDKNETVEWSTYISSATARVFFRRSQKYSSIGRHL